jgi:hypothetical protein
MSADCDRGNQWAQSVPWLTGKRRGVEGVTLLSHSSKESRGASLRVKQKRGPAPTFPVTISSHQNCGIISDRKGLTGEWRLVIVSATKRKEEHTLPVAVIENRLNLK